MKKILSILLMISLILFLTGCFSDKDRSFTIDGVTYDYNIPLFSPFGSLYIREIEDREEITIPARVRGKKVTQIGKKYNSVIRNYNTKSITIQHEFKVSEIDDDYIRASDYYVFFPNLEKITFLDFVYCSMNNTNRYFNYRTTEEITVPWFIGEPTKNQAEVILKRTNRIYNPRNFVAKVINIPEYVTTIEKGVFDGLKDVVIKTSYKEKPVGWEEGWNGKCEVLWGQDIDIYAKKYYRGVTEEGIEYSAYYDEGVASIRGFWDIGLNKEEYVIPEYIDGRFAKYINVADEERKYNVIKFVYPTSLTIQTPLSIGGSELTKVEKVIFIDFLYCRSYIHHDKLVCTFSEGDGSNSFYFPKIELRKSNRGYTYENVGLEEIIILDNVTVIEKGVFDGLTDVVIKTSYKEKPDGWEEGWNGDCEVIWGVEFEYNYNRVTEIK